ncbi:MAG TPA: purine-nucleoside phosphorylase, partial [Balneola sp.]|nr:purine-nucleoside phosphorylase [Balneola sp.]
MSLPDHIFQIKDFLVEKGFPDKIEAVVILGSGLGDF